MLPEREQRRPNLPHYSGGPHSVRFALQDLAKAYLIWEHLLAIVSYSGYSGFGFGNGRWDSSERLIMRSLTRFACAAFFVLAGLTSAVAEDKFIPLFDGKSLTGWSGDPELWKVEDGMIVGSTDAKTLKHNSFLATEKSYKNFVLKVKFKLRNHNSGVQIRSKRYDDYVVKGYQPDFDDRGHTGILYEEGGRGILATVNEKEVAKHFHRDGWNEYVITCDGPHIKQVLNGFTTVDYTEKSPDGAKEGIIALQLHKGPKMKVWFKDIEIKELP